MQTSLKGIFLLCSYLLLGQSIEAQTGWERSVLVEAKVEAIPTQISLEWPEDPNANTYEVFRKSLDDDDWGMPIATLPGSATNYQDQEVAINTLYDYAIFKKNFDPVIEDDCLESGLDVRFVINNMYGIGLCCNFGVGYFSLEACGQTLAYGDDFGFTDTTFFSLCDAGDSCEAVVLTIIPDMFPNGTSWNMVSVATGEIVGTSGPIGTHISERPKYGFISVGITVPAIEAKGTMLLLVEENLDTLLNDELDQLELDLIKDHWKVKRQAINDSLQVTEVKAIIQNYYQNINDLTALYLIGHIPVPYSGNIYPDTHSENHQGAWSADTYYADMDGTWTDTLANITTAFFERNHNIPGDGKFDQGVLPSKLELQIGRVDLSNLPAFAMDEVALTRQYLQKAHAYKIDTIKAQRRALIDDNFGVAFAAPSASGWRNFAPMFGAEQIEELDYFETMSEGSYMWSYGCGSGTHLSSAGIGATSDFANDSLQSIFTMLFGSQFGDWDNVNNFLRAPLASGTTLSNCWAGSPPWSFHHMAMGYPIGYSALRSMNSDKGVYLNGPQLVHLALLGDPSLRMFNVEPLAESSLQIEALDTETQLSWPPADHPDLVGYNIYRADTLHGDFVRINDLFVTDTSYLDVEPLEGKNVYQVKVVILETSASGTFYNQSLGVIDSLVFTPVVITTVQTPVSSSFEIFPNPSKAQVSIQLASGSQARQDLQIFNARGVLLRQESLSKDLQLNVEAWESGVYFFKVGKEVRRFVKF